MYTELLQTTEVAEVAEAFQRISLAAAGVPKEVNTDIGADFKGGVFIRSDTNVPLTPTTAATLDIYSSHTPSNPTTMATYQQNEATGYFEHHGNFGPGVILFEPSPTTEGVPAQASCAAATGRCW